MSALTAVQEATIQIVGTSQATVYSSTDQLDIELRTLLKKVGEDIAKSYDWPGLTVKATFTGDGSNEDFALPSDYDRMPIKSNLYSTRSQIALARVRDLDQWLEFEIEPVVGYPGYWILLNDQISIKPALASAEEVRWYYISRNAWKDEGGTPKQYPTLDTDTYRLPERLLTLALIWRWRAMKRLEYGEDMANYNLALSEEIGRAKGSRIMRIGRPRIARGVSMAFPGQVDA